MEAWRREGVKAGTINGRNDVLGMIEMCTNAEDAMLTRFEFD